MQRLLLELWTRDRRLAIFGATLVAFLLPMSIALGLDDRTLRGVNVWLKPMKFALSIGLLSLTTAWFAGYLPAARRASRSMTSIAWLLIATGSFELAYITIQASLGQASHYNVGDPFHALMYNMMGIGAILLTATQPMLAWQLYRHPNPSLPAAYRLAILLGLTMTFVLGASAAGLLSAFQPLTVGATVPVLGWAVNGGDLRPAHFVGIHSEQVLPLIGYVVTARGSQRPRTVVWALVIGYTGLFAVLLTWGLVSR